MKLKVFDYEPPNAGDELTVFAQTASGTSIRQSASPDGDPIVFETRERIVRVLLDYSWGMPAAATEAGLLAEAARAAEAAAAEAAEKQTE